MDIFDYLVSVIVPVYNAQKYLPKAIRSLRKQTLSQDQIEILLIDDGSTDNSPALCDHYAQMYDNVRVFHQKNAGVSSARNKGLAEAKGKYLAFLDADDWISKETLDHAVSFFKQHDEETDVVGFTTLFCYPKGQKVFHQRDLVIKENGIFACSNDEGISLTRLSVLVKNKNQNNEQFDPDLRFHEDEDYLVRVLGEKGYFGYVKEARYYYRQGTGGLTATASSAERLFEPSMRMYQTWIEQYRQSPEMFSYIQNCILGDFAWKLREGRLFPIQPEGTVTGAKAAQIQDLIALIDDEKIMSNPMLDFRDRFFLLALKKRKDQTDNPGHEVFLFLTAVQIKEDSLTVVGMLANGFQSCKDLQLSLVSETSKKQMPIRIREFSWAEPYIKIASDAGYYGFFETIPWNQTEQMSFHAEKNGNILHVQCCSGPDVMTQKENILQSFKQRTLYLAISAGKRVFRNVRLYCGCEEEYQKDKDKKDNVRRYWVRDTAAGVEESSQDKNTVLFRTKKHRLLFLIAEEIVIGSPCDRYIPIYEKTYRDIRRGVSHKIFISQRD